MRIQSRHPATWTICAASGMLLAAGGCASPTVAVRPVFCTYEKVVIDTSSSPKDKGLITPLWMNAFKHQLLDWDYAKAQLKVTSLRDPADVRKARTEAGVKGVVLLSEESDRGQLSIWVIDTENGETAASVLVKTDPEEGQKGRWSPREKMIEEAVGTLSREMIRVRQTSPQQR